jgi:hypothetical protein
MAPVLSVALAGQGRDPGEFLASPMIASRTVAFTV